MAYRVTRASVAADTDVTALADNETNGIWVRTGAGTGAARTIIGTANELTVTNGDGVSGNPTLSIPSTLTLSGKTIIDGTFSNGTFSGPTVSGTIAGDVSVPGIWTFTGTGGTGGVRLESTNPNLRFYETDAPADEGRWRITFSAGQMNWRTATDADAIASTFFSVNRTGTTVDSIETAATSFTHTGNGAATTITGWTASNTDIDGLTTGSTFGTLLKSTPSGHFTFGLQDNDAGDGFQFVTGGGDYTADNTYDTLAFSIGATGNIFAAGTLDLGHASDTTVSRLSAGQLAVEGVQVATASNSITLSSKTLSSPTFTGTIAGTPAVASAWAFSTSPTVPTPSGATDAANKAYVDSVAVGLQPKTAVACATTANITLSGEQTIDGVLTSASRVLVKNQTTVSQNGIYVSAAGAWSRATDMDAWSETIGAIVPVTAGTTNANTIYVSTASAGGTIGSTDLSFTIFINTSGLQPLDSDLTAIAALSTTAYGRSLLTLADAAALQTTAGLVIGTNVQAYDADLLSWASVTRAAGFDTFAATPSSANLASLMLGKTGTGSLVFATSPTLVTPDLGTPSAIVLSNATGLPISTGVSGLGADVATFLGTPSSANLAAAITDETGSGALVFATSPTLVTPNLGTPSAATLTNATGLPISTGVSGLGTGVATFLATPSSANLRGALTDETGSGAAVFATSPTLVTPNLGTPSAAVLTNATGLPISSGVSGLGSGIATFLATPTSANLLAAVTDETGTGSLVFATSPTLVTPNIGTPSAAVLTNATGLPVSTGISGLGTGVATFLANPSSANLRTAITDETGTGSAVFATAPTITNPSIDAASGTIIFPSATVPAQTAEGSVVWDTNDDKLTVGTGSTRKTMVDTDSAQTISNKSITPTGDSVSSTLEGWLALATQPWLSVLHPSYGVAADGTTNDTAGIALARADAESTGRLLVFPGGRTYVSDPVVSAAPLRVWGMPGATFKLKANATAVSNRRGAFIIQHSDSAVIWDGVIDGNRADQGKAAYLAAGGEVVETIHAVYAIGSSGTPLERCHFKIRGKNWVGMGLYAFYLNHSRVEFIEMDDSGGLAHYINCSHTTTGPAKGLTIDHDQWLVYPHLFDLTSNSYCSFGEVSVADHAGNGTTGSSTTLSAWVSGITAIDNWHCTLQVGTMFWRDDVALQKSLAQSYLGNVDFHVTGGEIVGYTDNHLEWGGNDRSTVTDQNLDGQYRTSTLDTSYTSWGVQVSYTNFDEGFLGRALRHNTDCIFRRVKARGFFSFAWYISNATDCEMVDCAGDASLNGVYISQALGSAHASFPKSTTQGVTGFKIRGGSFSDNEADGISHLTGNGVEILDNPTMINNGQAINSPYGTRRDRTTITSASGYAASSGGTTKTGLIIEAPDVWDNQSTTGSYVSYDPSAPGTVVVADPKLWQQGRMIKIIGAGVDANLAIGSTTTAVAYGAFDYYIAGTMYSKVANTIGVAPGNDVIPIGTYGAVALEVGTDGTVDVIEASANATGYASAALAIAGLPKIQASHVRIGTVTATKSDGAFTFGTTALNAANTTVAYTDTVDLVTMIDRQEQDNLYLRDNLQRFPLVSGTGTIGTNIAGAGSTTITGVGTDLDDEAPFRAFIRASSQVKQLYQTTTNTAAKITAAFSSDLAAGTTFEIYRSTADQIRSQSYGITLSATLSKPKLLRPNFGTDGNVTANISDATGVATPALIEPAFRPLVLGINEWSLHAGTPAIGTVGGGRANAWLMDAASVEYLAASIFIPSTFSAFFKATLYWCNAGAGAGDVVWKIEYRSAGSTDTLNTAFGSPAAGTTATAGAQDAVVETNLGNLSITVGEPLFLRLSRTGTDGSDTLANDAGVLALVLEPIT